MVLNEDKELAISGKQKVSVRGETDAVSGTRVAIVRNRHPKPLHPPSHQHQEVEMRRGKRSLRGRSPSGNPTDSRAKNILKGTCTESFCDYWHPPNVKSLSPKRDVSSAQSAHFRAGRLKDNQAKGRRRVVTKCSGYTEKCETVGVVYCRTSRRRNLQRFHGTVQKFWDQFDEYDSQDL